MRLASVSPSTGSLHTRPAQDTQPEVVLQWIGNNRVCAKESCTARNWIPPPPPGSYRCIFILQLLKVSHLQEFRGPPRGGSVSQTPTEGWEFGIWSRVRAVPKKACVLRGARTPGLAPPQTFRLYVGRRSSCPEVHLDSHGPARE